MSTKTSDTVDCAPASVRSIRVWALLGAHTGDNHQIIALAEALGVPFEVKQLTYNRWRHFGPRWLGRSLISLKKISRDLVLGERPPDLTISAGHRSVAIVQALRKRSGGRTRSIHIGFPRISSRNFDLVISTPQYPGPDHPNLLRVPCALTRFASGVPADSTDEGLGALPRPRRLLVVGGPALYWNLNQAKLREAISVMLADAASDGGSVLVATSPRTPAKLTQLIEAQIARSAVPVLLARPGQRPLYADLLAAADTIRVTADSVSMISDAIWMGKAIGLVQIKETGRGRALTALSDRLRPGQYLYPQDLRFFWRALAEIGIGEVPAPPRISTDKVLRTIVDRAREVLDGVEKDDAPLRQGVHRQSNRSKRPGIISKLRRADIVTIDGKLSEAVEALD